MTNIKHLAAIETEYRGVLFRSRLEAKWASFFDQVSWPWQYEAIDLNGYIPDFIITFPKAPMLVEVKPELYHRCLIQYAQKVEDSGWKDESLIVGTGMFDSEFYGSIIGLLDERGRQEGPALGSHWWGNGKFHKCRKCGQYSVHHEDGSYFCRFSGCYDGRHYLEPVEFEDAFRMFAVASQQARWNP